MTLAPGPRPTCPCRPEKISDFQVPEHQNPSKNRALRAPRTATLTSEIGHGALTKGESEYPAKTTYSMTDFFTRN